MAGRLARGVVHAVRQQHHEHLALGIDPERRAGEAGVAVGVVAEVLAAAARAAAGVPAERARAGRALGEQRDRGVGDDARAVVLAAVEHHLREDGEVGGGAEQPGVAGDAAERVRVLVVHFALERIAARRSRLRSARCASRSESAGRKNVSVMPSGSKTRSCEELVEPLARRRFDDEAEHVGAEVGVLVAAAGLADERRRDDRGARFVGRVRDAPEVAAGRQTRAMLEQHADA